MTLKICPLKIIAMLYIYIFQKINKNENLLAYNELLLHKKLFRKVVTIQTHNHSDT